MDNDQENKSMLMTGFLSAMQNFFRDILHHEADHLQSKSSLFVYHHLRDLTFIVVAEVPCEIAEYHMILTMLRTFLRDFSNCFYEKCEKDIINWVKNNRIDIFNFTNEYNILKKQFEVQLQRAGLKRFNFEEGLNLNKIGNMLKEKNKT